MLIAAPWPISSQLLTKPETAVYTAVRPSAPAQ
jgi:hypothetical protein